jgi:hypothetical protein
MADTVPEPQTDEVHYEDVQNVISLLNGNFDAPVTFKSFNDANWGLTVQKDGNIFRCLTSGGSTRLSVTDSNVTFGVGASFTNLTTSGTLTVGDGVGSWSIPAHGNDDDGTIMGSSQIGGSPTQAQYNALQTDVKNLFDNFWTLVDQLRNTVGLLD